jgi:hypothetical protein
MLSRSIRLQQLGMLFLSERDQLTVHWARVRGGFMVQESIKKIEEHLKETQRLVEEAKQHESQANLCCYRN